jgi:hypothetical protein
VGGWGCECGFIRQGWWSRFLIGGGAGRGIDEAMMGIRMCHAQTLNCCTRGWGVEGGKGRGGGHLAGSATAAAGAAPLGCRRPDRHRWPTEEPPLLFGISFLHPGSAAGGQLTGASSLGDLAHRHDTQLLHLHTSTAQILQSHRVRAPAPIVWLARRDLATSDMCHQN